MAETAAPIAVYTVRGIIQYGPGVSGHYGRSLSQFVGRAQELTFLHERLAYATQGQGQVVGIVGELGKGQPFLVQYSCFRLKTRMRCLRRAEVDGG